MKPLFRVVSRFCIPGSWLSTYSNKGTLSSTNKRRSIDTILISRCLTQSSNWFVFQVFVCLFSPFQQNMIDCNNVDMASSRLTWGMGFNTVLQVKAASLAMLLLSVVQGNVGFEATTTLLFVSIIPGKTQWGRMEDGEGMYDGESCVLTRLPPFPYHQ
mgnify:CR=1 FL=1